MYMYFGEILNKTRFERSITPNPRGVTGTKSRLLKSSGIMLSSGEITEFIIL